ncbi:hypothetical protein [Psychromonas sp.]|uniref:hypothetical protein n=1 Tax=Psychromonas sp. TaxID=1884585 RepID=UPI003565FB4D
MMAKNHSPSIWIYKPTGNLKRSQKTVPLIKHLKISSIAPTSQRKASVNNKQLKTEQNREVEQQSLLDELSHSYEVNELAGLEKSELIRTILKLNRQLKAKEVKLQEIQLALTEQQGHDLLSR